MELILLENVLNLGNIGDKVKVKDGYGRNFLLKQGKALRYNKENSEIVNKKKNELIKKNTEMLAFGLSFCRIKRQYRKQMDHHDCRPSY